MTFSLGTLRGEAATAAAQAARPMSLRRQLGLVAAGIAWLLALLALVTYNAQDAAFTTSGASDVVHNKVGRARAWLADFAYFILGHSV